MSGPSTARRLGPDALAELEEERDFLLRSLGDLERERAAGDLDEADYCALKDDYTARAAEALRALELGRPPPVPEPAAGRRGRRALTILVVAAVAVSAGLAVAAASGTRLPGDTLTGDIRQTTPGQLQQAATLASQGDVTEALRIYDEVLADDPANLEALSERGLLLVSLASAAERPGLADQGRASIEQALAIDPANARALFYLGLALRLQGDDEAAANAFSGALAADPPPALRQSIEAFLASIAEGGAPPAGG